MWTLHTANPEHWVPVKTVASFKRMREFSDYGLEWVTEALRTSDALEVDEKGENVRRRTEVTEPKGQFERSIYAVSPFVTPRWGLLVPRSPPLLHYSERLRRRRTRTSGEA